MERIPLPPNPNGWFAVDFSDELEVGQVKPLKALGRDLVLFRDATGAARVLDAFCPHLGAHLGYGGSVDGTSIVCPFHAWRWDGASGQCTEIPYTKKIPPKAQVPCWNVMERNGLVLLWHHADGAAPDWEPELVPEVEDPDFVLWKRKEWELPTHPQEIMENGVDFAHFETLHGWKAKQIDWEDNGPYYRLKIHVDDEAAEQAATAENTTDVNSYNSGPGLLYSRAEGQMSGVVLNCLTPIEPEKLCLRHVYYHHKDTDPAVYSGFFEAYWRDWELDIAIWARKIHRIRPVLADGDGPDFMAFRRWYRQFYSNPPADPGAA